jgi:hypothetical protein
MQTAKTCSACYLLHTCFLLDLFLTLKMQATCSSETLVYFQQITWCYIPEERTGSDVFPLMNLVIVHVQVCFTTVTLQTCIYYFFSLAITYMVYRIAQTSSFIMAKALNIFRKEWCDLTKQF